MPSWPWPWPGSGSTGSGAASAAAASCSAASRGRSRGVRRGDAAAVGRRPDEVGGAVLDMVKEPLQETPKTVVDLPSCSSPLVDLDTSDSPEFTSRATYWSGLAPSCMTRSKSPSGAPGAALNSKGSSWPEELGCSLIGRGGRRAQAAASLLEHVADVGGKRNRHRQGQSLSSAPRSRVISLSKDLAGSTSMDDFTKVAPGRRGVQEVGRSGKRPSTTGSGVGEEQEGYTPRTYRFRCPAVIAGNATDEDGAAGFQTHSRSPSRTLSWWTRQQQPRRSRWCP